VSFAEGDARAALWLGPDEQLLLVQQSTGRARCRRCARAWPGAHALVDISARQMALQVSGTQAADLLNCGCPLDLHPLVFP